MQLKTDYRKYSILCLIALAILSISTLVLGGMQYHQTMKLRELCNLPPRMEPLSKEQAITRVEEEQMRIRLRISIDASTLFLALLGLWCATRKGKDDLVKGA